MFHSLQTEFEERFKRKGVVRKYFKVKRLQMATSPARASVLPTVPFLKEEIRGHTKVEFRCMVN